MSGNTAFAILMVDMFLLIFRIWALLACASRPRAAYEAAHRSKTLWVAVLIVSPVPAVHRLILVALWYLFGIDRAVRRQAQIAQIGFPGGPPQY